MSLRKRGIGLSAILGFAFLVVVAATADETEANRAVVDGKRVLAHVPPPALHEASTWRQGGAKGERQEALLRPGRSSEQAPRPRVLVRDLRDRRDRPSARESQFRYDSRRWSYRAYPPDALLYSPYGYYYGYDAYPVWRRLVDAYRAQRYVERKERERRFNRRDMAERKKRLLDKHGQALEAGLRRLKEGEHARAIVALTLAAKLDQGDPACRIHLAQARLAQGHYLEAGLALRRALQLQPKLIYADLHLQKHYEAEGTLDRYTDALTRWVGKNAPRPEVHFLLGFLEFQRGDFEAAHAAFRRAADALPDDDLTRDYLEITKPAATK